MSQTTQRRQPAGIPTGGRFVADSHARAGISLSGGADPADTLIRVGTEPVGIAVAEARRALPEGQQVQVVYLNGQRPGDDGTPDIRTVGKQTNTEMTTTGPKVPQGSHLRWAKQKAERDAAGNIIVSDEFGRPYVAYVPLPDGHPGFDNLGLQVQAADDLAEAKGSTVPGRLYDLAHHDRAAVRQLVAKNPATSPWALGKLARDPDETVRTLVAQHPSSDASALALLASDPSTEIRYRVATHPNTGADTLNSMAADGHGPVRSAVAQHPNTTVKTLRRIGETERDTDVRHSLARNPSTPPDILAGYSRGHGTVMTAVAANPSTPTDVLTHLAQDTSTGNSTRAAVAANPSAPAGVRSNLVADADNWVREHAAQNPALTGEEAGTLAADRESRVRRALAGNPGAGAGALIRLAGDEDPFVRAAAAKNPALPAAHLDVLSRDGFHAVRSAAVQHPAAPAQLVRRLATEEGNVGNWARRVAAEREIPL